MPAELQPHRCDWAHPGRAYLEQVVARLQDDHDEQCPWLNSSCLKTSTPLAEALVARVWVGGTYSQQDRILT